MDSIDFDNVKAEKAKALRRYHSLRSIGRAAEVCVALLFLSWTFTRLPVAVQISSEFLRRLSGVVSTPLFMFLLGNSIVITLLAKPSDRSAGADADFYEAFVRSGEHRARPSDENQTEEIVYDDKQVIVTETNSNSNSKSDACEEHAFTDAETDSDLETDNHRADQPKIYLRSKSEVSLKQSPEIRAERSLRRSETEKCRRMEEVEAEERDYPEDKLSNEEFQKTIEAFIAKQLRFHRREFQAVVLHSQASSANYE